MGWYGLLSLVIFSGLAVHTLWLYRPCFQGLRRIGSPSPSSSLPRANVVICLKGYDPFLDRCLECLANQDYPNYRLTIVVDSEADEAYAAAVRLQSLHHTAQIQVIPRDRSLPHCSRKVSSLLAAYDRLTDDDEIVAVCDGDAVTHPTWLRELAAGLQNPEVSAVSGNRWYVPPDLGVASLSRYYWNALAVPTMVRHQIIWGGSLAIRASICREPAFHEWMAHAFSEDTATAGYLKATNRKFHSLPSLLIINTESITPSGYWNFLVRQMMSVRLNHPEWTPVLIHGLAIGLAIWILLPLSWLGGWSSARQASAGLTLYASVLLAVIGTFEFQLRRRLSHHPAFQKPFGRKRALLSVWGLIYTAGIYPLAVTAGWLTRSHTWRGVHYRVQRRGVTIVDSSTLEPSTMLLPVTPAVEPAA